MSQSRLTELTWREVRRAGEDGIALLPIGSQEQHAAHLPMGTDTLLVEAVVDRALALLDRETPAPEVVRLPALPFGHSPHHLFAAAVSLSAQTLGAVLDDVLDSLVTSGFRRIMVVNGHGGNDEIMRLAVKRLALRAEVTAAACSYWTLSDGDHETGPEAEATPGHAGWFETSLMLAAHPGLVRTPVPARAPVEPPPLFDHPPHPGLTVERHGEWERVDGSTDDASGADPDRGSRLLDGRARGLARAMHAFDRATRSSPRTEEKK
ncbi:creatininase family protein [Streptomyces albidoflavus]|uniref:creatininase family protein n=1 Tax=Streptomyces TaxID=1883 RepID=UPI0004CA5F3D|nr:MULTISPECIES: creatininase family protein [Streptomyces]MBL0777096.1 creatininase family protein [Streptomyces albidoflavus]MCG5120736.1 creatininase family protein [Streptomyces sp. T7(2022)]MCK2139495.1 creatininase family protein [Streptomyces sp. WAC00276]MCR0989089.1 creatininase family protein [Streptomyces albidoflavus]QDD57454.1 creatininase family protein [Streptomyces albidoflavus]